MRVNLSFLVFSESEPGAAETFPRLAARRAAAVQPHSQGWLSGQGMVLAAPGAHPQDLVGGGRVGELNLLWRHLHSTVEEDGWESAG